MNDHAVQTGPLACKEWAAIVRALLVGEQMLFVRLRMDVADNRRVRRARTQISLLRRGAGSVIVIIGGASALMTFPGLRTFGGTSA